MTTKVLVSRVLTKLDVTLRTAFILRSDCVHSVLRRSFCNTLTHANHSSMGVHQQPILYFWSPSYSAKNLRILARTGKRISQSFLVFLRNPQETGQSPNLLTLLPVQTSPKFVWPVATAWCWAACCPVSGVPHTRQRIENWDRFVNWRFWNEVVW